MPVIVASDLDRTLIYSAAALALTMPDARAPRLLCVEVHESKPLSYMTETAARLLTDLGDEAVFVPTTTRTRKQYQRINLPGPPPTYAICANGADLTLAAGDSLLDADLLLAVDQGWRPGHGELADADWTAPAIRALPERGVLAGERILREFLQTVRSPR
jgi:hypothetical protein